MGGTSKGGRMATATEPTSTTSSFAAILERLGGIDPARVRVLGGLRPATEDDLIRENQRREALYELVDGLLVEKGMGYNESGLALALAVALRLFIRPRKLGLLTGADGMMRLFPGQVRMPDLAFASWDRMPGRRRPTGGIAGFAPDLAIEILSRSNTKAELARKREDYFAAGVRLVWEFDPVQRTVAVYEAPEDPMILDATMTLDGGEVLPGFVLSLAELFAELDEQGDQPAES